MSTYTEAEIAAACADAGVPQAAGERLLVSLRYLRQMNGGGSAGNAPDVPGWKPSTLPFADEQLKTAMANATAARAYAIGADPKTAVAPAGLPWCREFARAVLNAAGVAVVQPQQQCFHRDARTTRTGDGRAVEFCPECGRNVGVNPSDEFQGEKR